MIKKKSSIGLDIGCSSIKLARVAFGQAQPVVLNLKLQEVEQQKDKSNALLEALKKILQGEDTKQARINVVINCAQSCVRVLTIPFMPKSEIPEALKWEMKNFISFSPEEAALDYEVIQEVVQEGVKKLKVCAACSPQMTVDKYLSLLNQAGVKPALFTHSGFALKNIIARLNPEKNAAVAVLDIGCQFSEFYIFRGNQLIINRKLPVAGNNFTQDMAQVLVSDLGKTQLTPQQAEEIKRKYGLPDSAGAEALEGNLSSSQLLSLLRPNVEKLAVEIERSFDFYREKEGGATPERLILLGGGSNLKNLAKNLSASLEMPVELGNPFKGLGPEGSDLSKKWSGRAHCSAQALGAALSSPGDVNLLPVEIKEETKLLVERSSIKALVAAVAVILILVYVGLRIRLGVYDQKIGAVKLEMKALAPGMEGIKEQAFLAEILARRIYWSNVFKEVGNRIPEQVRLSAMTMRGEDLFLNGQIRPSSMAEEKVLTQFIDSLSKGIFKQVSLVNSKKGTSADDLYSFEIKLGLQ